MREIIPLNPPETVSLLDKLRMEIYHGELMPGQRLVEAELASQHETSRGAVRHALAMLGNEGLVHHERNRGAWVRPVSLAEAIEITEVRSVLEGLCAAKAAANITARERRELRGVGRQMSVAVSKGDIMTYNRTSQEVHTRIREVAGQETVAAILERLRYQSVRYQFQVTLLPGRLAHGLEEHLAIIEAVSSGDAAQAEQVMREHLLSVIGALRRLGEIGLLPFVPAAARK